MPRWFAVALTAGALLWAATLVAAPVALSRTSSSAAPVAALVYHGSSRICHQRPDRSFRIAGVQQPVCARCAGLYVSGAAGALAGWIFAGRRTPGARHGRLLLAIAALPTALTVLIEAVGIAQPSSGVRAIAAVPLGAAAAWLFVVTLRAEHEAHGGG